MFIYDIDYSLAGMCLNTHLRCIESDYAIFLLAMFSVLILP